MVAATQVVAMAAARTVVEVTVEARAVARVVDNRATVELLQLHP